MFERLTERGRLAINIAQDEARDMHHSYVGTEHILLGLVRENEGVAARILLDFDADAEKIRNEIIRMLSGPGRKARTVKVMVPPEPTEAYRRGWNHGYAAGLREAKP